MGVATNQIATKGDLMKCGFTEISTSITDTECATYGDIHKLNGSQSTGDMFLVESLFSTLNYADSGVNSGIETVVIEANETVMFKIATYNIPNNFYLSDSNYIELGRPNAGITISTLSTVRSTTMQYLYVLSSDEDDPAMGAVDAFGDSVTLSPNSSASLSWYFSPRNVATNIGQDTTLYLYLILTNQTSFSDSFQINWNQVTSGNLNLNYIPLRKCIKYSVASSKKFSQLWLFSITESVTGKTKADNISVRYAYKTSSTATETYVNAASCALSDPDAANGTFSTTYFVQYNPRKLLSTAPYSSRLTIWCGSTSSNQSWSYRVRKRNGVWTSWCSQVKAKSAYVDPLKDFPELLTSNPYSSLSGGDAAWLQAVYAINGVEFKIT